MIKKWQIIPTLILTLLLISIIFINGANAILVLELESDKSMSLTVDNRYGSSSASNTTRFYIHNSGDTLLYISTISATSMPTDVSAYISSIPYVIAPGGSDLVNVKITANSNVNSGNQKAVITVASDGGTGNININLDIKTIQPTLITTTPSNSPTITFSGPASDDTAVTSATVNSISAAGTTGLSIDTIVSEFKMPNEKVTQKQNVVYDANVYAITQVGSTYIVVEEAKGVIPGQDIGGKLIKAYQYSIESKNIDRTMVQDINSQANTVASASDIMYKSSNGIINVIDGLSTNVPTVFGVSVGVSPRDVADVAVMATTGMGLNEIRSGLVPIKDASKKTYDVSSSIVSATSNLLNKINKLTGNQIQYSDATSIENDISTINTNIGIVTNEIDNVRNTMKSTVGMLQQLQSIGGKLPGVSSLSSSILDAEYSLATASSNLKTQSSSLNSIASNANSKSSTETQKSFSRLDSTVDVKINNADNAKSGINNLMANLRDSGINVQIAPETSSVLSGMEEPLRSAKSFKGNDYYASIIDAKKASVEGEKAAKSAYENTINHVKSYTSDVENSAYLGNVDISDASNQIKKAESKYEQIKYVDAVISLDSAVTSLDDSLKGATLKNNLMVGIGAIIAMLIIFVVIKTQRKKKKDDF